MSWLMGIVSWVKSHIVISIIISIVVVGGGITGVVVLTGNKEELPPKVEENKNNDTIVLKDNLKFEINSELTLLSLISDNNKVKILSNDEKIDTSMLGEKEVTIKYQVEEKEQEEKVKINIVDTTPPIIEFKKELSTTTGTKIDLLKDVKVTDNSKEDIKATIEGNYDINKVDTYKLKYVAVDSSNNRKEEEFVLKVNKKETTNNNKSNNSTSNNGTNKPNNNSSNNSNNGGNTSNNTNNNVVEKPKYDINLNDNVMYAEVNDVENTYIRVKKVCLNKTIGELRNMYPNHSESLNDGSNDSSVFEYFWLNDFPDCEDTEAITQGFVSQISSNLKGFKVESFTDKKIHFKRVLFYNRKYEKYITDLNKYGLLVVTGYGYVPTYEVLDETMCSKYNLSCGRW